MFRIKRSFPALLSLIIVTFNASGTIITIPLSNLNNTYFYGEIQIGTPPQNFKVAFDNELEDLWVPSVLCTSNVCQPHNKYNSTASSTYIQGGYTISQKVGMLDPNYRGPLQISGQIDNETITIGGYQVPDMPFAAISSFAYDDFEDFPIDGVCGLMFNYTDDNVFPIYEALMERGELTDLIFAMHLNSEPGQPGSSLIIGGYDYVRAPYGFNYYDIAPWQEWVIEVDEIGLGNTTYNVNVTWLNTAEPFIYVSVNVSLAIFAQIGTLDCTNIRNYPNFYVQIEGVKYEVPPSKYIFGTEDDCILGIQGNDIFDDNLMRLGTSFIRSHYTAFDFGNAKIGFAKPPPQEQLNIIM